MAIQRNNFSPSNLFEGSGESHVVTISEPCEQMPSMRSMSNRIQKLSKSISSLYRAQQQAMGVAGTNYKRDQIWQSNRRIFPTFLLFLRFIPYSENSNFSPFFLIKKGEADFILIF